MIYWKRLFQARAWKKIIACIGVALFAVLVMGLIVIADIKGAGDYSTPALYSMSGYAALLSGSSIAQLILGLYVMKLGLVSLPMWSIEAQEKSEFSISNDGDLVHITFRDWSWTRKADRVSAPSLVFHDDNHKFVTVDRAYQVYMALEQWYPEQFGKKVKNVNDARLASVRDFEGSMKLNDREKQAYIQLRGLNNRHSAGRCIGIIVMLFALFPVVGLFGVEDFSDAVMNLLMAAIIFGMGYLVYWVSISAAKDAEWINSHDVWKAKAWIYSRQIAESSHGVSYIIKVWDKQSVYLQDWFPIDKKVYNQNDDEPVTLFYYVQKDGRYHEDVLSIPEN